MAKTTTTAFALSEALLTAFATNNRINVYMLENVPPGAWSAKPPEGAGRTIAEIAAHMHNVRLMWLKAVGAAAVPAKLEETASAAEVIAGLGESHAALATLLQGVLVSGLVKGFKPDAAAFYTYLVAHDAHHRGQIASLARRLGHALPKSVGFGMWEWGSRGKEV